MNELKLKTEEITGEIDKILSLAGQLGRVSAGEIDKRNYTMVFSIHFPLFNLNTILYLLMRRYPNTAWNVTESTITARPDGTSQAVHSLPFTAPAPGEYPCLRM